MRDIRQSDPFDRGPARPVRFPQVPTGRVRFQLKELLEPGEEAAAYPLTWDVPSSGGTVYFQTDTGGEFTVKDILGCWGVSGDRGVAELFPDNEKGQVWAVVENPGQAWYYAELRDDLTNEGYTEAIITGGGGTIQVMCPLLDDDSHLESGSLVRVSIQRATSSSWGTWHVIGAGCE